MFTPSPASSTNPVGLIQWTELTKLASAQAANTVLRSGDAGGVPAWGSLTSGDIPAIPASKIGDSTALGRGLMTAVNPAYVRGAIDAAQTLHTHTLAQVTDAGNAAGYTVGIAAGQLHANGAALAATTISATGNITGSGTLAVVGTGAIGFTGSNNGEAFRTGPDARIYSNFGVLYFGGFGSNSYMVGAAHTSGGPNGYWGLMDANQRGNSNPTGFRAQLGNYSQPSVQSNMGDITNAVGFYVDVRGGLTQSGAKIQSWRNAGTEKASVTAAGGASFSDVLNLKNVSAEPLIADSTGVKVYAFAGALRMLGASGNYTTIGGA